MRKLLLRIAGWIVSRYGGQIINTGLLTSAMEAIEDLADYVDRSGHLNTVRNGKPHAVHKLNRGLGEIYRGLGDAQLPLEVTGRGAEAPGGGIS
jgi:hypothetical protein